MNALAIFGPVKLRLFVLILCFVGLLFRSQCAYAQSNILLLGGQSFNGKLIEEQEEKFIFEVVNKKGKTKTIGILSDRIFSITTNQVEKIYYEVDTNDEDLYSVEEMRMYIYGQQDAAAHHKTSFTVLAAGAVSASLGFVFGADNNALLLTSPVFGALAGGAVTRNQPKPENARDPQVLSDPAYVDGYIKAARTKKILNSIKAGIVGGIVGSFTGLIYANNTP